GRTDLVSALRAHRAPGTMQARSRLADTRTPPCQRNRLRLGLQRPLAFRPRVPRTLRHVAARFPAEQAVTLTRVGALWTERFLDVHQARRLVTVRPSRRGTPTVLHRWHGSG